MDLQESQIESFLEAGRSLQIDGIAGDTELVHLDEDGSVQGTMDDEDIDDGNVSETGLEEMELRD